MSYYQRPAGDYKTYGYAGDPGFLSGLWKGIKKVAKIGIGYYTGGLVGAAAGAIGQPRGQPGQPPLLTGPGTGRGLQTVQGYPIGMSLTMPGGTSLAAQGMIPRRGAIGEPVRGARAAQDGMLPSGYHWSKDGLGKMVRNRRMNIANPRALRRAMRRVQGFEKLAKRTIVFTRRTRIKKRKSS